MVKKIVWIDEKFFCLHQKPHRKNDGVWEDENPHHICEMNNRNDEKMPIFVAIVHGMTPIVHASLDLHGNKIQSMEFPTSICYKKLFDPDCIKRGPHYQSCVTPSLNTHL